MNFSVIIEAAGTGSESADGPGPSILGSIDNIFRAVKDFDQYRCIERMLCEYMQEEGDVATALLTQPFRPAPGSSPGAAGAGLLNSFLSSGSQHDTRFGPGHHHQQHHPEHFSHHNVHPQHHPSHHHPPHAHGSDSLVGTISDFIFGRRRRNGRRRSRTKRQSNVQGNIIRLFQATGMDNSNFFPYVRAALIGHGTRKYDRGGSVCRRAYRDCPTNPDDIVHYLNNHNGGLVNQVEPSVNQEIAPLISSIVSDAVGPTEDTLINQADSVLTSGLIHGAVNYFTGSSNNNNDNDGADSGSSLLGGLLGAESSLISGAVDSLSGLFSGKRRK